jgi:hypothetical protein
MVIKTVAAPPRPYKKTGLTIFAIKQAAEQSSHRAFHFEPASFKYGTIESQRLHSTLSQHHDQLQQTAVLPSYPQHTSRQHQSDPASDIMTDKTNAHL